MNAQINDIIALYKPDKNAGYVRHIYQYRVTVEDIAANPKLALSTDNVVDPDRFSGEYVTYGACYIVGDLPESLTSKREFKEIPWPIKP